MGEIRAEAARNGWSIFESEIPHSRGFPKIMRGDYRYRGNSGQFQNFSKEFFDALGL